MLDKTTQHPTNNFNLFQPNTSLPPQKQKQTNSSFYINILPERVINTTQIPPVINCNCLVRQMSSQIDRIGLYKASKLIAQNHTHNQLHSSNILRRNWTRYFFLASKQSYSNKLNNQQSNLDVKKTTSHIYDGVVLILGAKGHLGSEAINKAHRENYQVIATSRHPECYQNKNNIQWIKTPKNSEDMVNKIMSYMNANIKVLIVINAIGGAPNGPKESMYDLNVIPAKMIAQGMKKVEHLCDKDRVKVRYVYLSSIASIIQPDQGYGKIKRLSEEITLEQNLDNVTIFRISYALNDIKKGSDENEGLQSLDLDNVHAYSIDQMASLPVHFLVGSGDQKFQFVFVSDLMDAIFNTPYHEGVLKINAVNHRAYTQETALKYCVEELFNKTFRPVYLPYGLLDPLVKLAPFGHLKKYAIDILAREGDYSYIDPGPFEEFVEHDLKEIEKNYRIGANEKLSVIKPKVMKHIEMLYKNRKNSKAFRKAIREYGPGILSQLCKAVIFGESNCDFTSNKKTNNTERPN